MSNDFLKIVYFDEAFVADFLQIIGGGNLKKTTEFMSEVQSGIGVDVDASASVGTDKKGLSKLFSVFSGIDFNIGANASAEISHKRDRIVKNILENTLLSDFIAIIEADKRKSKNKLCNGIEVFPKLTVRPEINSFSYMMLIAPYLNMIDGYIQLDGDTPLKMDLAKMEQAIDRGRGFYEFVGIVNNKKVIFRFNRSAFRNCYTMSDLPKMQLTYYAIKVGQISISELEVQKEFEFGTKTVNRMEYDSTVSDEAQNSDLDVYDVVLAGVTQNDRED